MAVLEFSKSYPESFDEEEEAKKGKRRVAVDIVSGEQ